jgi:predicted P-loop ATPase
MMSGLQHPQPGRRPPQQPGPGVIDVPAVLEFLKLARPDGGELTLLCIPAAGGAPLARTFEIQPWREGDVDWEVHADYLLDWVAKHNASKRNLYWLPNETALRNKKPTKEHMTRALFAWADCDPDIAKYGSYGEARGHLLNQHAPYLQRIATFVVDSGNGLQALFRLDEPLELPEGLSQYEHINAALGIALLGPGTFNADRILRVPGTTNWPTPSKLKKGYPDAPRLSRILSTSDHVFDLDQLAQMAHVDVMPALAQNGARAPASTNGSALPNGHAPVSADAVRRFDALLQADERLAQRWAGDTTGLTDTSGSGLDMSMYGKLTRRGFAHVDVVTIMTPWPHGSVQGRAQGDRYWSRMRDKADAARTGNGEMPPPLSAYAGDPSMHGTGQQDAGRSAERLPQAYEILEHHVAQLNNATSLPQLDGAAKAIARDPAIFPSDRSTLAKNYQVRAKSLGRDMLIADCRTAVRFDFSVDPIYVIPEREKLTPASINNLAGHLRAAWEPGAQQGSTFVVAYDQFQETVVWRKKHSGDDWSAWADNTLTALAEECDRAGFQTPMLERLRAVIELVASEHGFDPAIDWLNGLVWDGVPRVATFAQNYLKVAKTDYAEAVSAYLWTALAGRCLVPGVKADHVVILASRHEGLNKSGVVEAMCPTPEAFGELDMSLEHDDIARSMRGKLVMEWSELRGFKTREQQQIWAFITRKEEEWTPKYREYTRRMPRRCVFVGTTNDMEMLPTYGDARRFLPLAITENIDVDAIRRDRDQLWAEAAQMFRDNGIAWQQAEALAKAERDGFRDEDTRMPPVLDWLAQPIDRHDFTVEPDGTIRTTHGEVIGKQTRSEDGKFKSVTRGDLFFATTELHQHFAHINLPRYSDKALSDLLVSLGYVRVQGTQRHHRERKWRKSG